MDMMSMLTEQGRREAEAVAARPVTRLLDHEGRTAVVTGAARGIGLAIARRLAESGAHVLMADRRTVDLERARSSLPAEWQKRISTMEVDVTGTPHVAALADYAVERTGRLDFWVNNAGIFPPSGPIRETQVEVLDRIYEVNIKGVYVGCREAARHMGRGAVILNVASIGAIKGQAGMSGYSASKHAVLGLTRSLAMELGKDGIRVMAIAPGLTVSPGNEELLDSIQQAGHKLATLSAPLGRFNLADDIARVALFAVSDMAAMMTGQLLVVDGGTTV
ncbi:MAG TPA: SDR family oxidoreductase [Noviherbaspirillum sp.]|uniref:SDR family NAD(P)-dependent oxidoreductase n=1 Tax=Noviherbaspirillum sp. TaxID=1926288 RepID=UPI002B49026E|nr:SDR family oxidoreductase [Noviherbaspirillum sp.]HJV86589.1 SDR family oxidoreductase [Noviherbaspirillum sp.]